MRFFVMKRGLFFLSLICAVLLCYSLYPDAKDSLKDIKQKIIKILNEEGQSYLLEQEAAKKILELLPDDEDDKKVKRMLEEIEAMFYDSPAAGALNIVVFYVYNGLHKEEFAIRLMEQVVSCYEMCYSEKRVKKLLPSLRSKSDNELIELILKSIDEEKIAALRIILERVKKSAETLRRIVWALVHPPVSGTTEPLILALTVNPEAAKRQITDLLPRFKNGRRGLWLGSLHLAAACFKMEQAYGWLRYLKAPAKGKLSSKEHTAIGECYLVTALDILIIYPTGKALPALKTLLNRIDLNDPPFDITGKIMLAAAYCSKEANQKISFKKFVVDSIVDPDVGSEDCYLLFRAAIIADDKTILDALEERIENKGIHSCLGCAVTAFAALDKKRARKFFRRFNLPPEFILYVYGEQDFLHWLTKKMQSRRFLNIKEVNLIKRIIDNRYGLAEKAADVLFKKLIENYENRQTRYNIAHLLSRLDYKSARFLTLQLLFDPDPAVRAICQYWLKRGVADDEWIAHNLPHSILGKEKKFPNKTEREKKTITNKDIEIMKILIRRARWLEHTYHFAAPFKNIEEIVGKVKLLYEREWSHFYYFYSGDKPGTIVINKICYSPDIKEAIEPWSKRKLTRAEVEREKKRIEKLKALMRELEELQYAEWAGMDVKKWRELTDEEKEKIKEKLRKEK